MFKPLELYIGLKYTRAKRRNHFISFISSISMGGIALAVMLLITVLSVMNGFEAELRDRILGMASHVEVISRNNNLTDWQYLESAINDNVDEVDGIAPYISGQGMLKSRSNMSGVMLRGILPDQEIQVSDVGNNMVAGSMDDLQAGKYGVVIGSGLAMTLGAHVGDSIDLMIPTANVTPAGVMPRFRRFTVVGIFEVGMYEYDQGLALLHLKDAQALYRLGDGVSGIRLHLDDLFAARSVAQKLQSAVGPSLRVSDWTRQHASFFHAIATEKTVMFIILSLIIAVAAFNIVSTLVMLVTDKQGDIAILRTLGLAPRSIMSIFMVQGSVIGVFGTLIGVVLGVLLSINIENIFPMLEKLLNTDLLSADIYYISQLKGELYGQDVLRISILSLILSFLSTLYPAWSASRVQPAEALRYD